MRAQRIEICGVPVDRLTVNELINGFVELSEPATSTAHICYINAHVHNLARRDASLRAVLHGAAMCYADGTSIVWASRLFGGKIPSRMTGADFFPGLLERLAAHHRRVFFLGGKPGVSQKTAAIMQQSIPDLKIVGTQHGFTPEAEQHAMVRKINAASPDLLIVGMGSPRQEKWIATYKAELDVPLVWAVGALFDYTAGEERRCPKWMGDRGLEWVYRLYRNPSRMSDRYLLGNPRFVLSVLGSKLASKPGQTLRKIGAD